MHCLMDQKSYFHRNLTKKDIEKPINPQQPFLCEQQLITQC